MTITMSRPSPWSGGKPHESNRVTWSVAQRSTRTTVPDRLVVVRLAGGVCDVTQPLVKASTVAIAANCDGCRQKAVA